MVPPIAGNALFQPRQPGLPIAVSGSPHAPGARPAYTPDTLARALREGIDAAGRPLNELMPRYELDAADVKVLASYLRTLGARNPAGVTAREMHLATIITPDVSTDERHAMLGVLDAAVRDHNAEPRHEKKRGERAILGHSRQYRAFRQWRLHVWELTGSPEDWHRQLELAVQTQPVFAVVSGIGRGTWQPIHDFCERHELPCLFPNTNRPPPEAGFYSLYLSRGIALEADLIAHEVRQARVTGPRRVVQFFRDDEDGRVRAKELRRALQGARDVELRDQPIAASADVSLLSWSEIAGDRTTDNVLWLGPADLGAIASGRPSFSNTRIYVTSGLLPSPDDVPEVLRPVTRLIHPFELPADWQQRRSQLQHWLKSHGLEPTAERIQANAYLVLNLMTKALKHVREPFSQDYLIERIEHATENSAWTSVYHELALGAKSQRFASKGGFVVTWGDADSGRLAGKWVIPSVGSTPMSASARMD